MSLKPASVELIEAVNDGDHDLVRQLLSEGADPNAKDFQGRRPVHLASSYADRVMLDTLIAAGADINALDNDGRTPLHLAALRGEPSITRALLEYGADASVRDKYGRDAVQFGGPRPSCEVIREWRRCHGSEEVSR